MKTGRPFVAIMLVLFAVRSFGEGASLVGALHPSLYENGSPIVPTAFNHDRERTTITIYTDKETNIIVYVETSGPPYTYVKLLLSYENIKDYIAAIDRAFRWGETIKASSSNVEKPLLERSQYAPFRMDFVSTGSGSSWHARVIVTKTAIGLGGKDVSIMLTMSPEDLAELKRLFLDIPNISRKINEDAKAADELKY